VPAPLALTSAILAAAGGGSHGFGGGGGGGGFGGGGGGGGGGVGYGGGGWGGTVATVMLIVLIVVIVVMSTLVGRHRYTKARRARARATHLAAAEAATDDEDFDPDTVHAAATELFVEVQRRWTARDHDGLADLVGPDLLVEWRRRLDDFERRGWHNQVTCQGTPSIEYLGLVNRAGEDDDRVVVRIEALLEDFVVGPGGQVILHDGRQSARTVLREWWTLKPPGDRWRVVSIEQEAEGRHQLTAELIATPDADARVADDALLEVSVADAVPAGVAITDIAPAELDPDARAAALDLSLADGRFAPDVLEIAARRAVQAWVEAVDGADDALEALAEPAAVDTLLYGGDAAHRTRVVVRGARITELAISSLDPHAQPATMTATVTVDGRQYVEDRDTTQVLRGSPSSDRRLTAHWTFALGDDPAVPWRLTAVA
jgi:predicted lipid-binding transport protein (Tim44 family)